VHDRLSQLELKLSCSIIRITDLWVAFRSRAPDISHFRCSSCPTEH